MKKTIKSIVTGGAGFIGSHLCDFLYKKGQEVICIDNLITGSSKNLTRLLPRKRFIFIKDDISNPFGEKLIRAFKKADYIYHLASPASPPQYQKYSLETLLVNSQGTYNVLKAAKTQNSRFLLASTSEVYGNPLVHPQKESYFGNVNPNGVRACYDEGKRCAETLFFDYHRQHNSH